MNKKYLEEIKAREQAVNDLGSLENIIVSQADVPELIAEVERLTAENEKLKSINSLQGEPIQNYSIATSADCPTRSKDQQISDLKAQLDMYGGDEGITAAIQERDTLKNALKLAEQVRTSNPEAIKRLSELHIKQAQQTHETQEAEK